MKRRISDILDGVHDQSVAFDRSAPLSSERIRELTMAKINQQEKKRKRIGFRLLATAAIIATLALTAVAAEEIFGAGDWFRDILRHQQQQDQTRAEEHSLDVNLRETISEGQIEAVNELGRVFEAQTQTSEGTTVTMHAAYGDAYLLHLYFSVEAPEGTVLPDDILYDFYDHNRELQEGEERYVPLKAGKDAPYKHISQQMDVETLPDANPGDNKKEFHVTIIGQAGTECRFNDGYSKFFNIRGIYQQIPNVYNDDDGYELLAPGNFSFDVGLIHESPAIELKEAEGFVYGGEKSRTWTHDSPCLNLCEEELTGETDPETGLPIHGESWIYEVTVKKMTISSMGVEWEVEYTSDDEHKGFGLDFRVVMKDGTSPMKGKDSGRSDVPMWMNDGVGIGDAISYFSIPIDLAEVDYILIGDEELGQTMKLYLPQ